MSFGEIGFGEDSFGGAGEGITEATVASDKLVIIGSKIVYLQGSTDRLMTIDNFIVRDEEGIAAPTGRVMSSLVSDGGLAGKGGLAGIGGGLAG